MKKGQNGRSECELSELSIKALRMSQMKKMIIYDNTIKLFEILGDISYEEFNKININPNTNNIL